MGAVCVYGEHIVIVLPQVFLAEFLHGLKHLFRGRILFLKEITKWYPCLPDFLPYSSFVSSMVWYTSLGVLPAFPPIHCPPSVLFSFMMYPMPFFKCRDGFRLPDCFICISFVSAISSSVPRKKALDPFQCLFLITFYWLFYHFFLFRLFCLGHAGHIQPL